jgi:transcription initiation factor TFIID TATA-box-binding protein
MYNESITNESFDLKIPIKTIESNQIDLVVNNVVCSFSTHCHLNLRRIALEGMHVEYRRENGMASMKLRKPSTTANIWSSGKVTCAGAKSEEEAYIAARRYCRLLQRMQFKVKMTNYRVVNVLSTCNLAYGINIKKLAEKFQKDCSYEPELHAGATFRLKDLKATLKIFHTGNLTITAPSIMVSKKALSRIMTITEKFKSNLI